MGDQETLEKARDELRKQFLLQADYVATGYQRAVALGAIEGLIKLGTAIEALDRAIAPNKPH
jgi:hypothetical protein